MRRRERSRTLGNESPSHARCTRCGSPTRTSPIARCSSCVDGKAPESGACIGRTPTRTGVDWARRDYDPLNFAGSDVVNQALSAAHSCLYGVVHSVVVALGCSPGLGFVHTGHDRSFVYDVADLYKADVTIPVAFDVAATIEREDLPEDDVGGITRRAVRDAVKSGAILTRCVRDIHRLLLSMDDAGDVQADDADVIELWDDRHDNVVGGTNFAPDDVEPPW